MARIVVTGGGVAGLIGAMLLADDGHEVTCSSGTRRSRPSPAEAWEDWERRGVNQFRLLHFFMPRFRIEIEQELPEVVEGPRAGRCAAPQPASTALLTR